jgi:hypothetical protein
MSCREGYRLENLSRAQLERKLELCRNYCQIFSILEPGTHEIKIFFKQHMLCSQFSGIVRKQRGVKENRVLGTAFPEGLEAAKVLP